MAPIHLAQVAIVVEDLDRARLFYRDVLGLPHLFDAPPGLAFFQCGETRVMLSRPEGPDMAGSSILYYGVYDVEAAWREMLARGVAFEEPPRVIAEVDGKPIHLAICRDSEGNLLGLISG
ncbi:MAG TPA: VOC family protein [Allosphingosinicella sp.]|jgi:methylmalonyl-CoA/ethylmalonyl-CoA epimerase